MSHRIIFKPFTELMESANNNISTLEEAFIRLYKKKGHKYAPTEKAVMEELDIMKNEQH